MDVQSIIKRHGFTQLQVAQAMALHSEKVVNPGSLSYSITKGNPTIGRLRQIADIIGGNITEFFEDELPAHQEQMEAANRSLPTNAIDVGTFTIEGRTYRQVFIPEEVNDQD